MSERCEGMSERRSVWPSTLRVDIIVILPNVQCPSMSLCSVLSFHAALSDWTFVVRRQTRSSVPLAKPCHRIFSFIFFCLLFQRVRFKETRANTGHAVLQSMPKPPKMRRRNGPTDRPTDRRTDGRTDGRTDPLIEVLCRT